MRLRLRKISVKLMAFNILLLSLPMVSLLYLDTYEKQLLKSQESSMIQQARMLTAALSGSDNLQLDSERIIKNLKNRVDSRIRVVDADGFLLADSSGQTLIPDTDVKAVQSYEETATLAQDTLLYRFTVYPLNTVRNLVLPPAPELEGGEYYSGKSILDGREVAAALDGRYGAATRFSSGGQRSINVYSAIPVYKSDTEHAVVGAVLVSRSTYQILNYLYELRLDIIRIFLIFLVLSVALSFGLAMSLTVPVVRLKNEAGSILDESGNFRNHFTGFRRGDEIGELSRSLTRLSSDLENKMEFIDKFTSDMLHELKNPLSAIKSSAEMALKSETGRPQLLHRLLEEEKRMERLLGELREISSLENRFENEKKEDVNLSVVLPVILSRYQTVEFSDHSGGNCSLRINPDRLVQAVSNPVDNAISFSPDGEMVTVSLYCGADELSIVIEDRGPGIPSGSEKQIFDRFYSDRPEDEQTSHSGLGLAIVKSIAGYYGGRCSIENQPRGGCRFSLVFLL
ncbi:MAG TPA: histidine kinase [Spirochaeta sp.]|nr:histidine kinase [Spirochaeta sp.]